MCLYGLAAHTGTIRADEIWFAVILCIVPATMVVGAVWIILGKASWNPLLGLALLVPSVTLWAAILVFAYLGFRLH